MPLQPLHYDLLIALLALLVTPAALISTSLIHDAHLSTGTCTSAPECISRALTLASSGQIPAAYPLFKRAASLNASDVSLQPLLSPAPRGFCARTLSLVPIEWQVDAWIGLGGAAKELGMVSWGGCKRNHGSYIQWVSFECLRAGCRGQAASSASSIVSAW